MKILNPKTENIKLRIILSKTHLFLNYMIIFQHQVFQTMRRDVSTMEKILKNLNNTLILIDLDTAILIK